MEKADLKKKYYYSRTLDRGLSVLELLMSANNGLGLVEISRKLNLDKSTVHRLVLYFTERGYLEQNKTTSKYYLGKKFINFGSLVLNRMEIRSVARPFLQELSTKTGKTAHLVVLNQRECIYIDKIEDTTSHVSYSRVGKDAPLHCTAVGKILLSNFSEDNLRCFLESVTLTKFTKNTIVDKEELIEHIKMTKIKGYAIDNFELEDSLKCISAPIYNHEGTIKAAMSISGMGGSMGYPYEEELIKKVCQIAMATSKQLGFNP